MTVWNNMRKILLPFLVFSCFFPNLSSAQESEIQLLLDQIISRQFQNTSSWSPTDYKEALTVLELAQSPAELAGRADASTEHGKKLTIYDLLRLAPMIPHEQLYGPYALIHMNGEKMVHAKNAQIWCQLIVDSWIESWIKTGKWEANYKNMKGQVGNSRRAVRNRMIKELYAASSTILFPKKRYKYDKVHRGKFATASSISPNELSYKGLRDANGNLAWQVRLDAAKKKLTEVTPSQVMKTLSNLKQTSKSGAKKIGHLSLSTVGFFLGVSMGQYVMAQASGDPAMMAAIKDIWTGPGFAGFTAFSLASAYFGPKFTRSILKWKHYRKPLPQYELPPGTLERIRGLSNSQIRATLEPEVFKKYQKWKTIADEAMRRHKAAGELGGYFGMVAGSLADTFVSTLLHNPNWIAAMANFKEQYGNDALNRDLVKAKMTGFAKNLESLENPILESYFAKNSLQKETYNQMQKDLLLAQSRGDNDQATEITGKMYSFRERIINENANPNIASKISEVRKNLYDADQELTRLNGLTNQHRDAAWKHVDKAFKEWIIHHWENKAELLYHAGELFTSAMMLHKAEQRIATSLNNAAQKHFWNRLVQGGVLAAEDAEGKTFKEALSTTYNMADGALRNTRFEKFLPNTIAERVEVGFTRWGLGGSTVKAFVHKGVSKGAQVPGMLVGGAYPHILMAIKFTQFNHHIWTPFFSSLTRSIKAIWDMHSYLDGSFFSRAYDQISSLGKDSGMSFNDSAKEFLRSDENKIDLFKRMREKIGDFQIEWLQYREHVIKTDINERKAQWTQYLHNREFSFYKRYEYFRWFHESVGKNLLRQKILNNWDHSKLASEISKIGSTPDFFTQFYQDERFAKNGGGKAKEMPAITPAPLRMNFNSLHFKDNGDSTGLGAWHISTFYEGALGEEISKYWLAYQKEILNSGVADPSNVNRADGLIPDEMIEGTEANTGLNSKERLCWTAVKNKLKNKDHMLKRLDKIRKSRGEPVDEQVSLGFFSVATTPDGQSQFLEFDFDKYETAKTWPFAEHVKCMREKVLFEALYDSVIKRTYFSSDQQKQDWLEKNILHIFRRHSGGLSPRSIIKDATISITSAIGSLLSGKSVATNIQDSHVQEFEILRESFLNLVKEMENEAPMSENARVGKYFKIALENTVGGRYPFLFRNSWESLEDKELTKEDFVGPIEPKLSELDRFLQLIDTDAGAIDQAFEVGNLKADKFTIDEKWALIVRIYAAAMKNIITEYNKVPELVSAIIVDRERARYQEIIRTEEEEELKRVYDSASETERAITDLMANRQLRDIILPQETYDELKAEFDIDLGEYKTLIKEQEPKDDEEGSDGEEAADELLKLIQSTAAQAGANIMSHQNIQKFQ